MMISNNPNEKQFASTISNLQ